MELPLSFVIDKVLRSCPSSTLAMNLRMIQYSILDGMVDNKHVQFAITLLKRHEANDPENVRKLIDMLGKI